MIELLISSVPGVDEVNRNNAAQWSSLRVVGW